MCRPVVEVPKWYDFSLIMTRFGCSALFNSSEQWALWKRPRENDGFVLFVRPECEPDRHNMVTLIAALVSLARLMPLEFARK